MPIYSEDIKFYKTVRDGIEGLGGVAGDEIVGDPLRNLFDDVSAEEAEPGDVEYRCFLVKNDHSSDTWSNVRVWLKSDASPDEVNISIGLDPNEPFTVGETVTIENEQEAPEGVTFVNYGKGSVSPPTSPPPLYIGNLEAGHYKGIWVRRTISPNTPSSQSNLFVLRFKGEVS